MSGLRTRKPSGQVAWPLILVEGEEKTGKSHASYSLSADERVGRTFVFDLGEGTADEYAELGPYEVVEHNGTYGDILDQLQAACAEPTQPGVPNVVVIDSATALWDLLKDWTGHRARNSKTGRRKLEQDPDAEVDVPMNLWNDANDRWNRVLNVLRRSNVVGVLVARAKETAKVQGGQPVAGQTDYKVEAQKGLPFAVTAQVRMSRPHKAALVAVRSLRIDVPAQGIPLPEPNPLAHLVFEVMKAGAGSAPAQIVHGVVGIPTGQAKSRVMEFLEKEGVADPKTVGRDVWDSLGLPPRAPETSPDDLARALDAAAEWVERQSSNGAQPHDNGAAADDRPIDAQQFATRAHDVFEETVPAERIPRGKKTWLLKALRHALVYAATEGAASGGKDATGAQLYEAWCLLDDIKGGRVTFEFNAAPTQGVTFTWVGGDTTSVKWSELTIAEAEAEAERRAEATA